MKRCRSCKDLKLELKLNKVVSKDDDDFFFRYPRRVEKTEELKD